MATRLSQIRAAAGRASVAALTPLQLTNRVTAAGNATLLQYGSGYYRAMGQKSAEMRKKKTA